MPDPFSGRGGRVSDYGKAVGFGGDGNDKRTRLSEANISAIQSTEKGLIVLLLTIDADGKVIETTVNNEVTTIKNEATIQQVIACVERDVKYEIAINAKPMKVKYFIKIEL